VKKLCELVIFGVAFRIKDPVRLVVLLKTEMELAQV
jgi:hypothetical protein